MADRSFHNPETQGVKHVTLGFSVAAASVGTNPPTFVEGDTAGVSAGSYVTCTKVATGKYRFKTNNPYAGCVVPKVQQMLATPTGNSYFEVLLPSQNADKTWQFEVWTYVNAAGTFTLTDMVAADQIGVAWVLRNSSVKP